MSKWRELARSRIAKIMVAYNPTDPKEFRRLAHDAYPFLVREHTPYKIWCEEVQRMARILGEPAPKPPREFWIKKEPDA